MLIDKRDYSVIAELAHLVITDQELRHKIVVGQNRRLSAFEPRAIAGQFRAYLDELLAA
jgi:hypothetical protein